MARAITVGTPLEIDATLDRVTGLSNGLTIPEADRGVHKGHLSVLKHKSIQGIPWEETDDDLESRFEQPVVVPTWQILGFNRVI